mgnify:CR=1 FL=1
MGCIAVSTGRSAAALSVVSATALSVLGSVAGTLLSFYMVFQGAYNLLTPLALLVFLLLWALPVLLLADWAGRY